MVADDGGRRLKEAGLGRGGRPPYVVRYGFGRCGNERDAVADEVTRPGAGEDGLLTSSATGLGRYGNERDAVGIW